MNRVMRDWDLSRCTKGRSGGGKTNKTRNRAEESVVRMEVRGGGVYISNHEERRSSNFLKKYNSALPKSR